MSNKSNFIRCDKMDCFSNEELFGKRVCVLLREPSTKDGKCSFYKSDLSSQIKSKISKDIDNYLSSRAIKESEE